MNRNEQYNYIEGKLQTRSWDDKEGNKKYTTEINALNVQFIGSSAGANNKSPKPQQEESTEPAQDSNFTADDIPFQISRGGQLFLELIQILT